MEKILIITAFIISCQSSYSQHAASDSTQAGLRKNAVHALIGYLPAPYFAYDVSYERMLFDIRKGILNSIWAKASWGGWGTWGEGGNFQRLGMSMLSGAGAGHIEINLGMVRRYDRVGYDDASYIYDPQNGRIPTSVEKSDYVSFAPSGAIGFRFQQPGGHFLFRFGIGYPEMIYLGLGVAF